MRAARQLYAQACRRVVQTQSREAEWSFCPGQRYATRGALACLAALVLAGTLVVARPQRRPAGQVGRAGEDAHVDPVHPCVRSAVEVSVLLLMRNSVISRSGERPFCY